MDFESTRRENDEALSGQLESIASAENIKVLVPFAKAYLGMFYVIDAELPAKEKVGLLANSTLAEAVLAGFVAAVKTRELPALETIAEQMAKRKEIPEGYVYLAGLDILSQQGKEHILELDEKILENATGFYYANKCNHPHTWFNLLFTDKKLLIVNAHKKFWVTLLKHNSTFLPGRDLVLGKEPDSGIVSESVLALLSNWKKCKSKILFQLLLLAFQYADRNEFLEVCEQALLSEDLSERNRLYWVTSAFLLSPQKHFALLNNYVGRVKIKVMPLLDFTSEILKLDDKLEIKLSAEIICQLLKIIAPIFPPQHHDVGVLQGLDINSRNVMSLFYHLAVSGEDNIQSQIKSLRKTRVMKIYAGVMDNLLELQMRKNNEEDFVFPGFDEYIKHLVEQDRLQGKSNRFD